MHPEQDQAERGFSRRTVEIVVAGIIVALACIVLFGSLRHGIGWGDDGQPESGFFPFYVALLLAISSGVTFVINLLSSAGRAERFVSPSGFVLVLRVLIPSIIFVALIGFIGIYVSTAILIGVFMRWLGRFGWPLVVGISVAVPVAFFILFERLFLVPLPKGPLETALGY